MLAKIFGDTYVRTNKNPDQYIAEYPICTQSEGYTDLADRVQTLLERVNAFMASTKELTSADLFALESAVEKLNNAQGYTDIYTAYTELQSSYATISAHYGGGDPGGNPDGDDPNTPFVPDP